MTKSCDATSARDEVVYVARNLPSNILAFSESCCGRAVDADASGARMLVP